MEICIRVILTKEHRDKFLPLYSVVNDAAIVAMVESLPDSSFVYLNLPVISLNGYDTTEIAEWFESYKDEDFYSTGEVHGWEVEDFLKFLKTLQLTNSVSFKSDDSKIDSLIKLVESLTTLNYNGYAYLRDVF